MLAPIDIKLLRLRKLPLIFAMALFSTTTQANPYEDRALCLEADNQLNEAEKHNSNEKREAMFAQLISQIANVKLALEHRETNTPRSYLQACLQKKMQIFNLNLANSPNSFKESSTTLKQLAKFYEENGEEELAISSYDKAIKKESDNYNLILRRFYLWISVIGKKIRSLPSGNVRAQLIAQRETEFRRVLLPLINDPKTPKDVKVRALNNMALLYYHDNRPEKAVEYYEELNKLDPTDPLVVENLIDYYRKRNREDRLLVLLRQLFKLKPDNLKASLEYAYIEIQNKQYITAALVAKQALQYHPQDAGAQALRGLALALSGRKEEGQSFISTAQKKSPKDPWVRIARAHTEYQQGLDFQERGLLSNALKHYEIASDLLDTQKNRSDTQQLVVEIDTQRAIIIYEFLKSNDFPKTAAARKDAAKVVEILSPHIQTDEKSRNSRLLVEVFFKSLGHSSIKDKQKYCKSFAKAGVLIPQSLDARKICL